MNELDRVVAPRVPPEPVAAPALGTSQAAFVGQVFWLVALMIAGAAAAGYLARDLELDTVPRFALLIGWFAMTFVVSAVRNVRGWNLAAVLSHALLSGVLVAPILTLYGAEAVVQALVLTGGVTVALGTIALTVRYDFSGWGGYLLGGLIALIVVQLVAVFFLPALFTSPWLAGAGCVLFSLLLVYDINRLKRMERTEGNAVMGAMSVYLDVLNLFLFILRLFGAGRR